MSPVEAALLALLVVALLVWTATAAAAELHAWHTRCEGALAALDAACVRRHAAALEWAQAQGRLHAGRDGAPAEVCRAVARAQALGGALDPGLRLAAHPEPGLHWTPARDRAETALTMALAAAMGDRPVSTAPTLALAARGVQHAHDLHRQARARTLLLRRRPGVRTLRLAGRTGLPVEAAFVDHVAGVPVLARSEQRLDSDDDQS